MYNFKFKKDNINKVDKDLLLEAVKFSIEGDITSTAPLGNSGDDIILFGQPAPNRKALVSIRKHSGSIKLLMTDMNGAFIFHGGFDVRYGFEFIGASLWGIYRAVNVDLFEELSVKYKAVETTT